MYPETLHQLLDLFQRTNLLEFVTSLSEAQAQTLLDFIAEQKPLLEEAIKQQQEYYDMIARDDPE